MPELPEVESLVRELRQVIPEGARFEGVELLRPDLRDPIPKKRIERLKGQSLVGIERRAKYLLFRFPDGALISHLGMTGSWRRLKEAERAHATAHDHVILDFGKSGRLVYRDPRRFGILDVHLGGDDIQRHKRFAHLGPEPLDPALTGEAFWESLRGGKAPIKAHVMNQKILVGVGNIYACEALFRAGISPRRRAGKVTSREALRLLAEVRTILHAAIAAGGSTIRDYRSLSQAEGSFQSQHLVYGRGKHPCPNCNTTIRQAVIGGRSSFWCPQCQH